MSNNEKTSKAINDLKFQIDIETDKEKEIKILEYTLEEKKNDINNLLKKIKED